MNMVNIHITAKRYKKANRVTPGVQPTLQALPRINEFMMELFPTLGIPTIPTRIDVLIPLFRQ